MIKPPDAKVVSIISHGELLVALGADGSIWATIVRQRSNDTHQWLEPGYEGNGWETIDGPFDWTPDGEDWDEG